MTDPSPFLQAHRVLVAATTAQLAERTRAVLEGGAQIDVVATVGSLQNIASEAAAAAADVVVLHSDSDDPRLWRTLMSLARPPASLPVIVVGPDELQTTSFLTGAEDWLPSEGIGSGQLIRTIQNTAIRRRVAGGLPTHGHLQGLVTGMAHEVNNPLTVINADLEEAAERLTEISAELDDDELADEIDDLASLIAEDTEAARRIGTLTRGLQNLARLADTVPAAVHTGPALRRVRDRLHRRCPEAPAPTIRGEAERPVHASVHGFEETLYQVILNGVQAQEVAGVTTPVEVDVADHGDHIKFIVRDRGEGLSADIHNKGPLTPFVSGRAAGEGIGLGLTLAALALRRAGGDVWVRSREGGGTEVELAFLPARARLTMLIEDDDSLFDEEMAAR